ncbi:FadR/GntR family transcriptional regulator [Streptomyces boncukensis]|uniref:FadR family transcriptional regulator n=1 Tax=Streptomyces boncukensis TaxID=2711219 RepID=A0A6G4WS78_9ACTN|nr:FadR/GntR family transcriptional regulator [Streptomyces boncukensis]NGO68055.1 FadR family transcriptional regulator [Streptomyces boncukensis]
MGNATSGGGERAAWRPVQRTRTFEAVLDRIDERIASGELRVGDRLPGERQLAALLGVSRPSVREAMRVLEARGVLTAQTGSGPEAGATLVADPGRALSGLVGTHLGLSAFALADVVEARWAIERLAVENAARHAAEEDLAPLREAVARMREPGLELSAFHALDTAFHVGLARLSGNPLLVAFMTAIRESVHRYAARAVEEMADTADGVRALTADHERILAAIEEGDAECAVAALDTHLKRAYPGVDRGTGSPAPE